MINYYFGLPGCGKTTLLVSFALKENRKINRGVSSFKRVLTNVPMSVPEGENSNIYLIDNTDFGIFDMSESLILFDESQMLFDNRDYKSMTPQRRNFLMLHRHYKCMICFFNQTYDGIDKKIRLITNNVYYLRKTFFTGKCKPRRLKYMMYVPKKPKRNEVINNNDGEITMRYYQCGFFENLFSSLFILPPIKLRRYWRYFDSFDAPPLPVKEFKKC